MALLSFRGIDTPSLAAQGEQRRLSFQHSPGQFPADWAEQVCAENIQWYSGKDAEVPRADKPDF